MALPCRFEAKKNQILAQLETPAGEYHDLSPKGSLDEPIRPLIEDINQMDGLVTTSSCSGRISVFLEGKKRDAKQVDSASGDGDARAGPGGKGGGSWLYISHEPAQIPVSASGTSFSSLFGLQNAKSGHALSPAVERSYIHLKFEPMILHILTASLERSQSLLTAALSSGFRESGAVSLAALKGGELNPMVAVRSTGYSFDSIIGYQDESGTNIALVDESYLRILVGIANDRFKINTDRIARFRSALIGQLENSDKIALESTANGQKVNWEDAEARKRRKREEGLARQQELQTQASTAPLTKASPAIAEDEAGLGDIFS